MLEKLSLFLQSRFFRSNLVGFHLLFFALRLHFSLHLLDLLKQVLNAIIALQQLALLRRRLVSQIFYLLGLRLIFLFEKCPQLIGSFVFEQDLLRD